MHSIYYKENNVKTIKFKEDKNISIINAKDIFLTEFIHKRNDNIDNFNYLVYVNRNEEVINKVIVVKPYKAGKYSLVAGYKWLKVAHVLKKPIQCIVVDKDVTHDSYVESIGLVNDEIVSPKGTQAVYLINDIKVPSKYKLSIPKKFNEVSEFFKLNNTVDKAITVKVDSKDSSKCKLVNGYARYLVLKENNIKYVPVKFSI